MQSIYLFNTNLQSLKRLQSLEPSIKAVWYDGDSEIIRGLTEMYRIKRLFVEENIIDRVQTVLGNELQKDTSLELIPAPNENYSEKGLRELPTCLVPSNDTHVYLFEPILKHLSSYQICVSSLKHESAHEALEQLDLNALPLNFERKSIKQFGALLTANDWGLVELYANKKFQKYGVKTICLQESIIQFNDSNHRMEWANYPLLQGIPSIGYLNKRVVFLTGNPRYERLKPTITPPQFSILINCNFTYGVHETIRGKWIEDVVDVSNSHKADYLIAQHPRDNGDLAKYHHTPSNAGVIHGLLKDSSILITRFSSLIHEALALGRPVIYYNPHGESASYAFEADGKHLMIARNKSELINAVDQMSRCVIQDPSSDHFFKKYCLRHLGASDGSASVRVSAAIKTIQRLNYIQSGRDISLMRLRYRFIRTRLGQRNIKRSRHER